MNSLKVVIADDNEKMVDVIKEVINDVYFCAQNTKKSGNLD